MNNRDAKSRFSGWAVVVVMVAIAVGVVVCRAALLLWDYLEGAGVIPAGL